MDVITPVTNERWLEAQADEFGLNPIAPADNYGPRNRALFHFCEIEPDQSGKVIVEVGCGPSPVGSYCTNLTLIVVEPLPYPLERFMWIQKPVEDTEFTGDEVWMFNVLQHVRDPELFVEKCKRVGVVRFFEPIDYPVSSHHPHTLTLADFQRWFGDCVKEFDGTGWPTFHDGPCAYGVWNER